MGSTGAANFCVEATWLLCRRWKWWSADEILFSDFLIAARTSGVMWRVEHLLHVMRAVSKPTDRVLHDPERAIQVSLAHLALDIHNWATCRWVLKVHSGIVLCHYGGRLVGRGRTCDGVIACMVMALKITAIWSRHERAFILHLLLHLPILCLLQRLNSKVFCAGCCYSVGLILCAFVLFPVSKLTTNVQFFFFSHKLSHSLLITHPIFNF